MKDRTKKILSRVGAGLMLGLSLASLGTIWTKQKETEAPRRTKLIKTKEQEDVRPETVQLAQLAQEEAEEVVSQQAAYQQKEEQTADAVTLSGIIRYSTVAVWLGVMGIFFTSMIFNAPFSLGKGVLSMLPGVPHTSTIELRTDKTFFYQGEIVPVSLVVDSDDDVLSGIRGGINFNPEALSFVRYEESIGVFGEVKIDASQETGKVDLNMMEAAQALDEKSVVTLYFKAERPGEAKVLIDREHIFLIEKNSKANVLGRIDEAKIRIMAKEEGIKNNKQESQFRVNPL